MCSLAIAAPESVTAAADAKIKNFMTVLPLLQS
jgi:hypothetical protein